jgi:hypothetical protein
VVELPPDEPPDEDSDEWDLNEREVLLAKLKLRPHGAIVTEGQLRVVHAKVRVRRSSASAPSPSAYPC